MGDADLVSGSDNDNDNDQSSTRGFLFPRESTFVPKSFSDPLNVPKGQHQEGPRVTLPQGQHLEGPRVSQPQRNGLYHLLGPCKHHLGTKVLSLGIKLHQIRSCGGSLSRRDAVISLDSTRGDFVPRESTFVPKSFSDPFNVPQGQHPEGPRVMQPLLKWFLSPVGVM